MPSVITLTSVSVADPVGEAHRVADGRAELGAELLGDPLGDRARRHPPRLGVADQPVALPRPSSRHSFGQLGALARPGLAGDDHDLVVADRLQRAPRAAR